MPSSPSVMPVEPSAAGPALLVFVRESSSRGLALVVALCAGAEEVQEENGVLMEENKLFRSR